jgi:hypothetical protein
LFGLAEIRGINRTNDYAFKRIFGSEGGGEWCQEGEVPSGCQVVPGTLLVPCWY